MRSAHRLESDSSTGVVVASAITSAFEEAMRQQGYSQRDVALLTGRSESYVSDVRAGRRTLSDDFAFELEAIGMGSAEAWVQLRLQEKRRAEAPEMERRQQLRDFHYAEAVKRGWLPSGGTSEAKLDLLKSFLGVSELVNASASAHFRSKAPSNAAYLWLSQVRQVADRLTADEFDEGQMPELVTRLKGLMADEHGVSAVVEVFASFGVRLVLLRALPGMRVDGAVVWDDRGPVIALTLRFDRIDWFWFTLMHEVAHVFLGHRETVVDVVKDAASSSSRADLERAADAKAGEWLIPMEPYNAFVARSAGYFTLSSVRRFADAIQRHPGIVVGRLQHDDFIGFDKLRAELVPVSKRLGGWIAE